MTFTPTLLGPGPSRYAFLARTRATQTALLAQSPSVQRNTDAAKARLEQVETAEQLLNDRPLLTVALGAFGLDEDINNRAFLEKILTSDLTDKGSLANKLADGRYRDLAAAFNFSGATAKNPGAVKEDAIRSQLANLQSADDLLTNPSLLRATLQQFGLERDASNVFFLQRVLDSDLSKPDSFANQLSDPRYAQLAGTLGLAEKRAASNSIYGFSARFSEVAADLKTPGDLLNNPDLLTASLRIFGLQDDSTRTDFLSSVLTSDLDDDTSFARTRDDPRYAAWADVFGFAERASSNDGAFTSKLQTFVDLVTSRSTPVQTAEDFFADARLMLAVFDFFDLPSRPDSASFTNRLIESDLNDPTSLINVMPDQRFKPFVAALDLAAPKQARTYPPGFAESIVDIYLERQFEIQVGETDPNMRLALGLGRDIATAVTNQSSNDAQWYAVLASKPLREVFETALNTPNGMSLHDIDRQQQDMKTRALQRFGTDEFADFAQPDMLDTLRERFLLFATTPQNTAPNLLSGAGDPNSMLSTLYRG